MPKYIEPYFAFEVLGAPVDKVITKGSITHFLGRGCSLAPCGPLLIKPEDPFKRPIVFGAPQRQHHIGLLHVPPRSRALQPHVADEFVGGLYPPTPDRVTLPAQ